MKDIKRELAKIRSMVSVGASLDEIAEAVKLLTDLVERLHNSAMSK